MEFAERLRALDVDVPDGFAPTLCGDLMDAGLDPESLAAVLSTCRTFPISDGTRTFTDFVAEEGMISSHEVEEVLLESVAQGMSTSEYLIEAKKLKVNALLDALEAFSGTVKVSRSELAGEVADAPEQAVRQALALDLIPWKPKKSDLILLSERPVMDFVLDALKPTWGDVEIRLTSPRVFASRIAEIPQDTEGEKMGSAKTFSANGLKLKRRTDKGSNGRNKATQQVIGNKKIGTVATEDVLRSPRHLSKSWDSVEEKPEAPFLPRLPVATAFIRILKEARNLRATDIHFDPMREHLRVRIRVDGLLRELYRVRSDMMRELIARIKVMAELDITERRRAQDGHLSVRLDNDTVDLRVATVPLRFGERVELRLANLINLVQDIGELGLQGNSYECVDSCLQQPYGIVLATGPVGSGKTTTLYTCLSQLDSDSYNIMSVEDPVEVDLDGVNQVNVNYKIGFDFRHGLRALLRHDPDVILVGEIRDEETAGIAIRAAMTGMLVFSSLHTNSAPGALTTLYNFKLPSHLIANSVLAVIAQRLLRRVCPSCGTGYKPSQTEIQYLFPNEEERPDIGAFMRGRGCTDCLNTGYLGRVGVFEVLPVSETIRDMITEHRSERAIKEQSISEGMTTLHSDAALKVAQGITSVEEVIRVLGKRDTPTN